MMSSGLSKVETAPLACNDPDPVPEYISWFFTVRALLTLQGLWQLIEPPPRTPRVLPATPAANEPLSAHPSPVRTRSRTAAAADTVADHADSATDSADDSPAPAATTATAADPATAPSANAADPAVAFATPATPAADLRAPRPSLSSLSARLFLFLQLCAVPGSRARQVIDGCATADGVAAWHALRRAFLPPRLHSASRTQALLSNLRWDPADTIFTFLHKLEALYQRNCFAPASPHDVLSDDSFLRHLLDALPPSLSNLQLFVAQRRVGAPFRDVVDDLRGLALELGLHDAPPAPTPSTAYATHTTASSGGERHGKNGTISPTSTPCDFCGAGRHALIDCNKYRDARQAARQPRRGSKPRKSSSAAQAAIDSDNELADIDAPDTPNGTTLFLVDTGATSHVVPHASWFSTYEPYAQGERLVTTTGGPVSALGHGTVPCRIVSSKGATREVILRDVLHLPSCSTPLFSVGAFSNGRRDRGLITVGAQPQLTLENGDSFPLLSRSNSLLMLPVQLSLLPDTALAASARQALPSSMPADQLHRILGHPDHLRTTAFAERHGVKLTGRVGDCTVCSSTKSTKSSVPATATPVEEPHPGRKLCLDVIGPYTSSVGGSCTFALVVVDNDSSAVSVYPTRDKQSDTLADAMVTFLLEDAPALGINLRDSPPRIHSDHDTVFTSTAFKRAVLAAIPGSTFTTSPPYCGRNRCAQHQARRNRLPPRLWFPRFRPHAQAAADPVRSHGS